jgi:hypothetical protein
VSGEFRVNDYTAGAQGGPAVALDAAGRFIVVWESSDQDGEGGGVFGRRFVADPIFRDGLETGTLDGWTDHSPSGDLAVSAEAALAGSTWGLAAVFNYTYGLFALDHSPGGERRYRARFYFDPNGFDPGEAQDHRRVRIFVAFCEEPTRRVATVVLRRLEGAYSVMGRARLDDDTRVDTGFFPISDAAHAVELELIAASDADSLDGAFELWIDGVSRIRLTGLDNSDAGVDYVRMGAISVKAGGAGTLYWDELESRRATYIGLLP